MAGTRPATTQWGRQPVILMHIELGPATVGTQPVFLNQYGAGPRHPRLCPPQHRQSWMAGTRPAMTQGEHQPVILMHIELGPAIHDFVPFSTANRGWPAQGRP